MGKLKIEYVKKDSLIPYANNAKLHTPEQVEQIKKSIVEFGFNDPIAVWGENEIIEGHGRLLAVMELPQIDSVPVIRLDDLTDEQRRAYMLVHNKLTMNTDFDLGILSEELDKIALDMGKYGFDIDSIEIEDIDQFIDKPEEPIARELDEANNYIVLEFKTEQDWEKAQLLFGLERVQSADKNENIRRHGIGRVIDGASIMERLEVSPGED